MIPQIKCWGNAAGGWGRSEQDGRKKDVFSTQYMTKQRLMEIQWENSGGSAACL